MPKYVLAANRDAARMWAQKRGLTSREWVYLGSPGMCRGCMIDRGDVEVLPGFDQRRDFWQIVYAVVPALT